WAAGILGCAHDDHPGVQPVVDMVLTDGNLVFPDLVCVAGPPAAPIPFVPPKQCPPGGTGYQVTLGVGPNGGWVNPDALVTPGTVVTLTASAKKFSCDNGGNPAQTSDLAYGWQLWLQKPGEEPKDVTGRLQPV